MSSRFKTTINIIALFVIIGFAVSVYFLCRYHDAKSTKREVVYLPKFAPEFLKEIAREEYILVEIEPNDPRISKEWIKEHINQQEFLLLLFSFYPFLRVFFTPMLLPVLFLTSEHISARFFNMQSFNFLSMT